MTEDDENTEPETRTPRSIAVTASAEELGIDPEEQNPVAEKITSSDEKDEPETRPPRSVAETISAEDLDIELNSYDPIMEDVEGVEMPAPDKDDE